MSDLSRDELKKDNREMIRYRNSLWFLVLLFLAYIGFSLRFMAFSPDLQFESDVDPDAQVAIRSHFEHLGGVPSDEFNFKNTANGLAYPWVKRVAVGKAIGTIEVWVIDRDKAYVFLRDSSGEWQCKSKSDWIGSILDPKSSSGGGP